MKSDVAPTVSADHQVVPDMSRRTRIGRAVSTALLVASIVLLVVASYRRVDLVTTDWTKLPKMFAGDSSAALVVFIFRPDECPGAMNVIDEWNRIAAGGTVRVRGLMIADRTTIGKPETIFAAQNVRFPTKLIDEAHAGRILASVGYRSSPVSIVIDSRSRLRAALPGHDSYSVSPATLEALGVADGKTVLIGAQP